MDSKPQKNDQNTELSNSIEDILDSVFGDMLNCKNMEMITQELTAIAHMTFQGFVLMVFHFYGLTNPNNIAKKIADKLKIQLMNTTADELLVTRDTKTIQASIEELLYGKFKETLSGDRITKIGEELAGALDRGYVRTVLELHGLRDSGHVAESIADEIKKHMGKDVGFLCPSPKNAK